MNNKRVIAFILFVRGSYKMQNLILLTSLFIDVPEMIFVKVCVLYQSEFTAPVHWLRMRANLC